MTKRKRTLSRIGKYAAMLLLPLAAMNVEGAVSTPNFPVGTHLIKGTLKDWKNKVLTSSASVTINAVAENGTIIASTKVADPTVADGYNFVLQIPLSTRATDFTAAVGDKLNCVLVREAGLSIAASPLDVGNADTVSQVNLVFVSMTEYTNPNDSEDKVNVPDEYVETIAPWMEAYNKEGDYDPFADYDDDGQSNYEEYRAGTNPFDATDKLAITAYHAPLGAAHPIKFEFVGGHVYGVSTTLSLTNPQWATQGILKDETDTVELTQVMPSADEEAVGETTIYVVPAEGATSQFFKLEAK